MPPLPLPPLSDAPPERRADDRLARVVHIGAAMIPAYGPLRAARFMSARGVPVNLLVALLRLGDRRRGRAARAWATLPWHPSRRHGCTWPPGPRAGTVTAAAAGSGAAAMPAKRSC